MILKEINIDRWKERGNVLFLILIAVALFAALSYAVTQSTRSSGGDAGSETNRINSAQLTQYPASVRTSIVRMVIGGRGVENLEFNSPPDFANCTLSGGEERDCVFHPLGGGATYVTAPGALMTSGSGGLWVFNGANEIEDIGTSTAADAVADPGAPASAPSSELIAFLEGITLGVCQSINNELGLPTNPIPTETGIEFSSASNMDVGAAPFATQTRLAGGGETIGFGGTALAGQPFGCFQQPAGNYVYYHVLVER